MAMLGQVRRIMWHSFKFLVLLSSVVVATHLSLAEDGYRAWLRYEPLSGADKAAYAWLPRTLVCPHDSLLARSAAQELAFGLRGMLGLELQRAKVVPDAPSILLCTMEDFPQLFPGLAAPILSGPDSFLLRSVRVRRGAGFLIVGTDDRALLYGAFTLLRKVALHEDLHAVDEPQTPSSRIRFLNHWDNLNGTIERGYGGRSIFWEQDHIANDLTRVRDYARLMASVGINGCSINNVNADPRAITPEFLSQIARVADELRPWGVGLLLSLDFASPRKIGGLDTFDPADPRVVEFWKNKVDEVYRFIPDLAGFILKADSEGRSGPSAYGRTHADAANVIARPLQARGGLLFYRGFVYDHHMDWRNRSLDRAKAAYDNFKPLDGLFENNVIVQIKHGPIDFQVREPPSPLFGALERTGQAIELQITQEYTGQQRHLCCLVPMWKEVLDFDLQAGRPNTPVKALVSGKTFGRPLGGFVGVSNVGRDANWLGHDLAVANLYGFGRLAWNPDLSAARIVEEWTRLTFGPDKLVDRTVKELELKSWPAYEEYTGPLGAGTLTDIIGPHYGPAVESSERNGWGQWHRADREGVGMDRTVARGTGFVGQYSPPVRSRFESLRTCPDELLLFMHHVPYTHRLHSGKTVIQHIYDSHYEGASESARFVQLWSRLKGRVDQDRFESVLKRLSYQAGHAVVWRDAINNWFLTTSGIADRQGRAGHFPNRIEAENMKLKGYAILDVKPWEAASGGKAVEVGVSDGQGSVTFQYQGRRGKFDLAVQYFDENDGVSAFDVFVAGQRVDHWMADDSLPSSHPDGHTSTRHTLKGISLRPSEEIKITGTAQAGERACLDYVEITPISR
jgi:alpha-glucuronidase